MTDDNKPDTLIMNTIKFDDENENYGNAKKEEEKKKPTNNFTLSDVEKLIIDTLLKEYNNAKQDINFYLSLFYKVMTLWLTIITGLIYYGFQPKIEIPRVYIFTVGAFCLVFIELVMIWLLSFIMNLGGYKASLEFRINKVLKASILNWDHKLVKKLHHKCAAQTVVYVICIAFTFWSIIMSACAIWDNSILSPNSPAKLGDNTLLISQITLMLIIILQCIAMFLGGVTIKKAHNEGYDYSMKEFDADVDEPYDATESCSIKGWHKFISVRKSFVKGEAD